MRISEDSSEMKDKALEDVVRSSTLTDQVYMQLRHGLLLGVWKPGEKITARSLSRTLGVSLTPAREAITRLANEGAIEVSETRMFSIPDLSRERYEEITDIRIMLEPKAAALAAVRARPGLVSQLDKLNSKMRQKIENEEFDEALRLDSEFHLTIYDAAEATVLRRLIDTLWLQVGPTRNRLSQEYRKQLVGYGNHLKIIDALKSGDAEAVSDAMRKDLLDGAKVLLAVLV